MANPFPFASGDVLTAADLNSIGEYSTYTPTFTASGTNPNVGSTGRVSGIFCQINDAVFASIFIVFSGSGVSAGSGEYRIGLPVAADLVGDGKNQIGLTWAYDSSGGYAVSGLAQANNANYCIAYNSYGVAIGPIGASVPFAWSTNDQLRININYKAA